MRRRGAELAIVAAVVLIGILAFARGPGSDSPEHSSSSDAANGTSALMLYAQALGHPSAQLTTSFDLGGVGLLFVFSPTAGFNRDEAGRVVRFAESGGIVVYADDQGDATLDRAFGIRRGPGYTSPAGSPPAPLLDGVNEVSGGAAVTPMFPRPEQAVLLRSPQGRALGLIWNAGAGRIVALADPLELCNGYLLQSDNGRLAADLIGLAPAGARVAFDEYHHGVGGGTESSLTGWLATAWGAAIGWAVLAVFAGLAARGRAFGPHLPLFEAGDRSTAEYVTAVGALLRRARAGEVALSVLADATRASLARRLGIAGGGERFSTALAQRDPDTARELAAIEVELAAAPTGEKGVTAAARRLHRIAYRDAE